MGNCSFPNTVTASTLWQETRVFVSLSAELFPCSDSLTAVSTRVKAATLCSVIQALTGENYEGKVSLQVASVMWSFVPRGCCLVFAALAVSIAWPCTWPWSLGHRDTRDRRSQSSCPNLPFPRNLAPRRCVSLWVNLRTISCATWQLSALPIPAVSAAVTSLPLLIYKQAQGTFRLWLDPQSGIQWHWWKRLQSPAPPRCLSKQLSQQHRGSANFSLSLVSPIQGTFNCYFFHSASKNTTCIVLPCIVDRK